MSTAASGAGPVDQLKSEVKTAIGFARNQNWDEFFAVYNRLFESDGFGLNKPDDQRQALKLMIMTKGLPPISSQQSISAYQSAWRALSVLTEKFSDARDYELLGLTHLRLQDEDGARRVLNTGLELAQKANDGDLCGVFLRHLSTL